MTPSTSGLPQLLQHVRNRHLLLSDFLLLPIAAVLAFALRLDSTQLQSYLRTMLVYAVFAPLIMIPIFAALGLYSRFWRYASADELLLLAGAAMLGALTQGALFFVIQALFPSLLNPGVPRSIPLIAILLTLVVIAAPRFALLLWSQSSKRSARANAAPQAQQRVLIAGAGEAGALILRELRANPQTGLIPVGFVDDDPRKQGMLIQRTRVLGSREAIPGAGARPSGGPGDHRHAHGPRFGRARDRGHLRAGRRARPHHPRDVRAAERRGQHRATARRADRGSAAP